MVELGKKVTMLKKNSKTNVGEKMLGKNVGTIFHGHTHVFNIS
jgi:UDP-2,3-diacylglucosamine pyrophosphatase LpxH